MFCSDCGAYVPDYSKSCPVCGANVYCGDFKDKEGRILLTWLEQ